MRSARVLLALVTALGVSACASEPRRRPVAFVSTPPPSHPGLPPSPYRSPVVHLTLLPPVKPASAAPSASASSSAPSASSGYAAASLAPSSSAAPSVPPAAASARSATVPVQNAESVVRAGLFPRARACYNAGLKADPEQQGRLVITLLVTPDGAVSRIVATFWSGLGEPTVRCIEGAAAHLVFAAPGGSGSTVTVPMNFVKHNAPNEPPPDVAPGFERAVKETVYAVHSCYRRASDDVKTARGAFEVTLVMGERGAVRDIRGEHDAALPASLAACVRDRLLAQPFELPAGYELTQRYVLDRVDEAF